MSQLRDRLVEMGFEDAEASAAVESVPQLDLPGGTLNGFFSEAPPPTVVELGEDLSTLELTPEEAANVTIERTESGSRVTFAGPIAAETVERLAGAVRSAEARASLSGEAKRHSLVWQKYLAPAQRGVPFLVPQLCFEFEGAREIADREAILGAFGWKLTDYSAELSEADFRLTETGVQWEVDLNAAGRITERAIGQAEQFDLDLIDTGWTLGALCRWLDGKVRQSDIAQPDTLEFVRRALAYLTDRRGLALTALVRWRFILAKVLAQRIAQCREKASAKGYQLSLFAPGAVVEASFDFAFDFQAQPYGPHWNYAGHPHVSQRHYYPVVGELKNRGEEYECARALDLNRKVRHWARNLERRGFALPLANGRFFPDFVAELLDGRLLVVEHKGEVYATNDDSKEKRNVGELWEAKSGGRGLFLMTIEEAGRPALGDQIGGRLDRGAVVPVCRREEVGRISQQISIAPGNRRPKAYGVSNSADLSNGNRNWPYVQDATN